MESITSFVCFISQDERITLQFGQSSGGELASAKSFSVFSIDIFLYAASGEKKADNHSFETAPAQVREQNAWVIGGALGP